MQVFHGEPLFWNKAHGTRPNPAPVYGRAKGRNGSVLDLDQEVLVHRMMSLEPVRGKIVAIGDEGHPDREMVRYRRYGSAYLTTADARDCEVWSFDEYQWLRAEETAATAAAKRNIDLARCMFGGFYFDLHQREVMKAYLAAIGEG